jgi:DNA-binding transcriptional ArsR family regulator
MTRPGGRSNAWIRDEATGEIVLRDGQGTEYARFPDADAVFTDRGPYPSDGERTVKEPIIPDAILEDDAADPHAEILEVPEGADDLADLSLRIGTDMTVPADAVRSENRDAGDHPDGGDEEIPAPDELDVPATAARFFDHLQDEADAGAGVSVGAAHDLAVASGDPDLDVSRRTVRNWLGALVEAGAVEKIPGEHAADPDTYRPR